MRATRSACAVGAIAALATAGCGSSSPSTNTQTAVGGTPSSTTSAAATTRSAASSSSSSALAGNALSADAQSAATGDIPDNQIFLVFTNTVASYSIKYPEGWTQSGSGADVTFRDKNNVVHVLVGRGARPTAASLAAALRNLRRANRTLTFSTPAVVVLGAARAVKATYTTRSAPNPVTGKSVTLIVDRYELASGGRVAVIDLGTPRGVDNVDAYRMMVRSFRWR